MSFDEQFDVLVIGAGHAGCEAASSSARMGATTALVTMNLDLIGQMSCNPAIGGIAKGHIVREIDALGGIMGRVIDRTGIQFRLLNRSRGLAVQGPRAQADRTLYRLEMRAVLEATPNLYLRQGTVVKLIVKGKKVCGVELSDSRRISTQAVIIATGTFLNGLIHTGRKTYASGRSGEPASIDLANNLKKLNFPIGRLKTGTPPRIDGRTVDWSAFDPQLSDEQPVAFSFSTESIAQPQITCFVGYTNERVHDIIRNSIQHSPLYSGQIKGVGPRYCPSIEDKVVKFPDKNRHQIYLEPEGHNTSEVYLNGLSTSMPFEIQQNLVRNITGLEESDIIRPGYAIEYDFIDPRELTPFMQSTRLKSLFLAGQINGTTGYEEAACQGLLAGINAALHAQGREGFRLRRDDAYIGVLIDDLINHGVDEPYRMFTSRAENRLSLRYDTADSRLSPLGRALGIVGDDQWDTFNNRRTKLHKLRSTLETIRYKHGHSVYQDVAASTICDLGESFTFAALAQRPDIPNSVLFECFDRQDKGQYSLHDFESVAADFMYRGYIDSFHKANKRVYNYDDTPIPSEFDYRLVSGFSAEMVERFESHKPTTFGEARRIRGLTPSSLSLLLVSLKNDTMHKRRLEDRFQSL